MRTSRRILYLDHTATLGGGEIALLNLVASIDRGRFCPIVALFSDGPLAAKLRGRGIETHLLPLADEVIRTRKDSLGARSLLRGNVVAAVAAHVFLLARFIRAHSIDLVYTNSLKSDIVGGLAGRIARKPVIWHVRDRIDADYLPTQVVHAFRVLCRTLPDYIIANSSATLHTLRLPSPTRSAVIASGIDSQALLKETVPTTPPNSSMPRQPVIGLIGRISRWKGQHVFLRAAARVRARFPGARFQIIGSALFDETDYEREIRALTETLGLTSAVEFTGFRDDVRDLISRMDVVVHASITGEPLGQVLIEAMAAGKPVVATRGGGVPEVVIDGQTGVLVPMNESDSMAEAICRLLADPIEAARMGQSGRDRVANHFTLERTAQQVQEIYDQVLR